MLSIVRITPLNGLTLMEGGKLLSAIAPLVSDTCLRAPAGPAAFIMMARKPVLEVEVRSDGIVGECRLTGSTEQRGEVFSGSSKLNGLVSAIPVALDQITGRFLAVNEVVTWELKEGATNKVLGSCTCN